MRDMTQGSPGRHLLAHALPLMLANWLQLMYNAVDAIIAGRLIGRNALAAEGIAAPVMNLVILAISGLCIGAGILMSERFGAGDLSRMRRVLAVLLRFGLMLCAAVALLGFVLTPWLLRRLRAPEEIFEVSVAYLRITFLGAPFTFAYNAMAAALKSAGDSRTPLRFLAFSAVLNAALDLLLLGVFHLGIITSAATTVVAEAASAALAWHSLRREGQLLPRRNEWDRDPALLLQVLRYGAPTAVQQAIQPIGKVLIQGQVNALGVSAIAAFNAGTRADDFACVPEQSISAAIATYLAQNRGAGRRDRLKAGFCAGMAMEVLYGALISLVVFLSREGLVRLFLTGEGTAEVIRLGSAYLGTMALIYILPGLTNGFQGYFRGMGHLRVPILGTLIQISLRTIGAYLLAPRLGLTGIALSCAVGWSAMLLFEIPYAYHCGRKQPL